MSEKKIQTRMSQGKKNLYMMLMELGSIYKSDASLYMGYILGNRIAGAEVIQNAKKNGLLAVRNISSDRTRKQYPVITTTHDGKWECVRKELCQDEEETLRRIEASDKDFDTHDLKDLNTLLMDARIRLAFEAVGIPAVPLHKPTLEKLYQDLSGRIITPFDQGTRYRYTRDASFYQEYGYGSSQQLIETGVFYSISEVRRFLESWHHETMEKLFATRARGVYISKDKICPVYVSPRGDNRNFYIKVNAELALLDELEILFEITEADRLLPELADQHYVNGQKKKTAIPENRFDAIIIGDTDNLVTRLVRKPKTKSGEDITANWLTGNQSMFGRVFEIPFTMTGLDSLAYITCHSIEDWHEQMTVWFDQHNGFDRDDRYGIYPATCGKGRILATYMPVYDCNQIESIRDHEFSVAIVTYSDMVPVLHKALARPVRYFDILTGHELTALTEETGSYDKAGKLKGFSMVRISLAQSGKDFRMESMKKLAEDRNVTLVEYSDMIERGEIPLSEVISLIDTVDKKRRSGKNSEHISFLVDRQFRKNLEDAARAYHLSISEYIRIVISRQVAEDAKLYRKQKEEDREYRKKKPKDKRM